MAKLHQVFSAMAKLIDNTDKSLKKSETGPPKLNYGSPKVDDPWGEWATWVTESQKVMNATVRTVVSLRKRHERVVSIVSKGDWELKGAMDDVAYAIGTMSNFVDYTGKQWNNPSVWRTIPSTGAWDNMQNGFEEFTKFGIRDLYRQTEQLINDFNATANSREKRMLHHDLEIMIGDIRHKLSIIQTYYNKLASHLKKLNK